MAKNQKWSRDEIILALDLYFQLEPGKIHASNPAIIALSQDLQRLAGIDPTTNSDFRNPNGASMKLSNFLHLDSNYEGTGLRGGSKLDREVFDEFVNHKEELHQLASLIKKLVTNQSKPNKQYLSTDERSDEESLQVREGKVVFRLHQQKERNYSIVKKKKAAVKRKTGKLACEVCGFDFAAVYGALGEDFIECHHKQPLSELNDERVTILNDLALVCANCHRMLHRSGATLSLDELRELIKNR